MSPSMTATVHDFQVLSSDGAVCWECHRIMVKFWKFRSQVKQAQEVLSKNIKNQLSTLTKSTKKNYDYEYTYYDPLLNTTEETKTVKAEPNLIKQEASFVDFDDTDYNEKAPKIFADSLIIKKADKERMRFNKNKRSLKQDKKKLKGNLKNEQLQCKEHRKVKKKSNNQKLVLTEECMKIENKEGLNFKFETVVFTEEEMLKCREEKRNQANFKKIPYKCDSCVTGFTKKENYDVHLVKKHDERIGIHICSVCETRFSSKTSLSRHQSKHYLQYSCRLCAYKVSSRTAAMNHCRDKHAHDEEDSIHCKQCAFVGRTSKELSEHMRTDHLFACNECGVKFKGRNTLRAHKIRIHCAKREFSCDVCSRTFINKSRLESHMARHSDSIAKRLAYCSPCRVQYKDIHVYRSHLRNSIQHVQDRVTCPDCNKKFASRVYWSKHYKFYHLRQSQYKCQACDKIFISEWRLKIHKQVHHGLARTRDHACAVCAKKFYSKASLHSHEVVHVPCRAFMCARCGDTFRQRAALHSHARLLHHDT